jgi:hypothetical protein
MGASDPAQTPPKVRLPWPILFLWALAGLDALGFVSAVVTVKFGLYQYASEGEGALGGIALYGVAFLPLLAAAWISTLLWKRRRFRLEVEERDLRLRAKLMRREKG